MRFQVLLLTTVAALVLGNGCAKKQVGDDMVANDIKAKLYSDPVTKAANINVSVKGGAVTLDGDVPNNDIELQAMKLANGTAGVTSVADNLRVNTGAASQASNQPLNQPLSAPQPTAPASSAQPVDAPTSVPAIAPAPRVLTEPVETLTIPAGQRVTVRTVDAINSATNTEGQTFRANLDAPLVYRDRVVVPSGAPVSILLTSARGAGRIKGNSELEVRLTSLEYRGRNYPLNSSVIAEQGKARGKQTAVKTGIGVAAGAIIGAIAGGGKGAAIGSAAGGGAGIGYSVLTHGQQVKIPSESVLTFRLEAPLVLQSRR